MPFIEQLQEHLETQESQTVGPAFGGPAGAGRKSYSVTNIRNWVLADIPFQGQSPIEQSLRRAYNIFPRPILNIVIGNLIRFSFLIELTNLKVGSTKMKTRWVPGLIQMPQPNSFEPIKGSFEPGNDPRASSFEECVSVFSTACNILCDEAENDAAVIHFIEEINKYRRVPYEFPLTYYDSEADPVHTANNITWSITDNLRWILRGRRILDNAPEQLRPALREIKKSKIQVKIYKTDRALTGKDKTNRAKRWEVLAGDFQHATLPQCWSSEKKITSDLVLFEDFPQVIRDTFIEQGLITGNEPVTRCPVTLEPLNYERLTRAVLNYTHGVSDYQIGHLHPLKRDGVHDGSNVCWQSADGNRIQGNLTIEETERLLHQIETRRQELA